MDFKEFCSNIKIPYESTKEWEILLSPTTTQVQIQSIINLCNTEQLVKWHIIHPLIDGNYITMYWDI